MRDQFPAYIFYCQVKAEAAGSQMLIHITKAGQVLVSWLIGSWPTNGRMPPLRPREQGYCGVVRARSTVLAFSAMERRWNSLISRPLDSVSPSSR